MTDTILWPPDLAPFKSAFYLQAHRGGSESPFSRVGKFYALSAPRWVTRLTFRAGVDGVSEADGFGPRLDALLAEIAGIGRVRLWDFRRPGPLRQRLLAPGTGPTHAPAAKGATSMLIHGYFRGTCAASVGDYVGGDGRAHIVTSLVFADANGDATLTFRPPLSAAIPAGTPAVVDRVTSPFRLSSDGADDAGLNEAEVGKLVEITLTFVEDLTPGT